jgi:hypothetical protein
MVSVLLTDGILDSTTCQSYIVTFLFQGSALCYCVTSVFVAEKG